MRVELLCVGTELLTGKVSTHSVGLSERLQGVGLSLSRETVVGDDPAEMAAAFKDAWRRADVLLCAGGLGPTFDDITRDVWARVLARPLKMDRGLLRGIEAKFRSRRLPMPPANRRQAQVISGAAALENPQGTAPGQRLSIGKKTLFLLPGPGREIFPMVDATVVPWLKSRGVSLTRKTRVWRIFGLTESTVDEVQRTWISKPALRGLVWGILAQEGVVDVKATAVAPDAAGAAARLAPVDALVRRAFGDAVYGEGRETMEESLGKVLAERGETLAAAESCTGGLFSERVTRVPGSSSYFMEARVTYADAAKKKLLGVPEEILRKDGAVSAACARAMARGVRRRAGTDWGVSLTGIAGPGGGSAEKPVGLVFMAVDGPGGTRAWEHRIPGDRARVREMAALRALDHLRREVKKKRRRLSAPAQV